MRKFVYVLLVALTFVSFLSFGATPSVTPSARQKGGCPPCPACPGASASALTGKVADPSCCNGMPCTK